MRKASVASDPEADWNNQNEIFQISIACGRACCGGPGFLSSRTCHHDE